MIDCKGVFGKLFGHKYVQMGHNTFVSVQTITRFDPGTPTGFGGSGYYYDSKEPIYNFKYVHSQCVRCGHIIKETK